ncbi:MAG: extracellular matrix regulator RemB [Oscillospiraceae bacterium]
MFLHLGNDYVVNTKDIIGIFDIENTSTSQITKDYLSTSSKIKQIISCTYEMPKSFVVCVDENLTEKIYISQISSKILLKRFNKNI